MSEIIVDFYYWVMPIVTLEWEVMQRGRDGHWYRMGMMRTISDRQIAQVGPMIDAPRVIKRKQKEEKRRMEEFIQSAVDAGFTETQANFMWFQLSKKPHTHETNDIVGLDDLIEEAIEEASGEDEEDEEEEE